MSTRSVIARPDADGFRGVYHHWDGYPAGVGATIFEVHRSVFKGDAAAMLRYLIDDAPGKTETEPGSWSTINGADWSQPAGAKPDENRASCATCGLPVWRHYQQYYQNDFYNADKLPAPPRLDGTYRVLGHNPDPSPRTHGPESGGKGWWVTHENASGSGCEWAYVIDEKSAIMSVLSSYHQDGGKAIGMFGSGDPDAVWKLVASVDLNGDEPDWNAIAEVVSAEAVRRA